MNASNAAELGGIRHSSSSELSSNFESGEGAKTVPIKRERNIQEGR
jgi:hypothetical protein